MHTSSVNPIDWKMAKGYLQKMLPVPLPMILCKDGAGVVERVGEGVPEDRRKLLAPGTKVRTTSCAMLLS